MTQSPYRAAPSRPRRAKRDPWFRILQAWLRGTFVRMRRRRLGWCWHCRKRPTWTDWLLTCGARRRSEAVKVWDVEPHPTEAGRYVLHRVRRTPLPAEPEKYLE